MTSMHETPDSHEQAPFSPVPFPETPASVVAPMVSDPELRHRRIAEAAYFLAEQKGFPAGQAEACWFAAEQDIDREGLAADQ
ncbi:DUF2934 domain-containing protein [Acidithiobacillus sp.]|uniref:DUF2934 domain-containing protein n=1 Tax=Acidithiobacillus sp. TaxID=1872118 RepID=UPI002583BAD3|nr:DUF2934 domain-containing protein [Acidithiobacillus sp.]MDD5375588.1 DUF2934 domain-containing protein [Acidithiobacillus sp.]